MIKESNSPIGGKVEGVPSQEEMRLIFREIEMEMVQKPDADGQWIKEVRASMLKFAGLLPEYFVAEKEEFFPELIKCQPRFAIPLERLALEHVVILDEGNEILSHLEGSIDLDYYRLIEFKGRIEIFLAHFLKHEDEERKIIESVFWDDLGES